MNERTQDHLLNGETEDQRGKRPSPRVLLLPRPHLSLLHFSPSIFLAAMRRNSKRKVRKKNGRRKCGGFSPFLHNVKKIAFANYRSLKAIRVFGGDSGHKQKRQSERPAQNFSSIHLYQAKGKKGVKSSNFHSRDGGDKIFTASKGGAWEGQGTPGSPLSLHALGGWERESKERRQAKMNHPLGPH